jgi:hypothetical protein
MFPRNFFVVGSKDGPDAMAIAKALSSELTDERIEVWRARLKTILEAAFNGPSAGGGPDFESQPESLLQSVESAEGRIKWTMSVDRNVGLRIYGQINEPDAFVAVITGLLLDRDKRELLGRCRDEKCRRFFVVKRTKGTTRKLYCSRKCMFKVHREGSAARQRNVYNRRRAADILVESLDGRTVHPDEAKEAVRQAFKACPEATSEQLAEHAKTLLTSARRHK